VESQWHIAVEAIFSLINLFTKKIESRRKAAFLFLFFALRAYAGFPKNKSYPKKLFKNF
jgi:hypothetical protein